MKELPRTFSNRSDSNRINYNMQNDWETSNSSSSLVSIGSRKLFLSVKGPSRVRGAPVVIVETELGDFSSSWVVVQRLVSKFARCYTYDRAGYGQSEPSTEPRTATNIAKELNALLQAANVDPPYVLVGHAFAGIAMREFLALRPKDVVGMVLVDTLQEKSYKENDWPMDAVIAVLGKLNRMEVMGWTSEHKLTAEEWKQARDLASREGISDTRDREVEEEASSSETLAEKKQFELQALGSYPLSVIKGSTWRDMNRMYEAGVKAGNGTNEQREKFKTWLDKVDAIEERMQKEQLHLSSRSRYIRPENGGHNMPVQQPEVIAAEVHWVLESLNE